MTAPVQPPTPPQPDNDDDVFEAFGVEDKRRQLVRESAAARVLANRHIERSKKKAAIKNPPDEPQSGELL